MLSNTNQAMELAMLLARMTVNMNDKLQGEVR